jgi:hypothetical protein
MAVSAKKVKNKGLRTAESTICASFSQRFLKLESEKLMSGVENA